MIPTVLLLEDHALVRAGIRSLLDDSHAVRVVGEAGNGNQAVELCEKLKPDLVLADVELPGLNGIETVKRLRGVHEDVKIIMLSTYADHGYVLEATLAGASGYVLKDSAFTELLMAIRKVMAGGHFYSPAVAHFAPVRHGGTSVLPAPSIGLEKLSPRERQVLRLLVDGNTSGEIGEHLKISTRTADAHRASIMEKLDLHTVAGLTKFALSHGIEKEPDPHVQ